MASETQARTRPFQPGEVWPPDDTARQAAELERLRRALDELRGQQDGQRE